MYSKVMRDRDLESRWDGGEVGKRAGILLSWSNLTVTVPAKKQSSCYPGNKEPEPPKLDTRKLEHSSQMSPSKPCSNDSHNSKDRLRPSPLKKLRKSSMRQGRMAYPWASTGSSGQSYIGGSEEWHHISRQYKTHVDNTRNGQNSYS